MTDKKDLVCIPREIELQAAMFRLGNINEEIQKGYDILKKYHKTVTFFGSARTCPDSPYYQAAKEASERLASLGYAVVSGGGHGIMGAANEGANKAVQKGARAAGGESIAFNIKLPHEQDLNEYATESFEFQHFAPRKIVMTMYADAYIYFPGGFGTLDELAEILTLIQTQKTNRVPVILFDTAFWSDLDAFFRDHMLAESAIVKEDLDIYTITDSVDEIIDIVTANKTYCDH
ncbi:TIGR00730 family Rossman fold protein [Candidatus Nanosynbacter featherlites]|uniref:Cytokinin riboside 5'-monophosphate phosphoribohydrolase n=1 Tax=Candidatus Nanosynbacter featherlites TaxID=2572088 RepID=A0A4P9A3E3_9BACT|nr:TIGR00730 family Rossman fold protein [Candidatus Nanosynbacter featherlites]QCT42328.1 TIGR00730 family Rossman fold protein [Candidatus Nanosynbacter featherlites]